MSSRARLVLAVALVLVALVGVVALVAVRRTGTEAPMAVPPPAPIPAAPSPSSRPPEPAPAPCVVARGARQRDVDTEDRPDAPWPRAGGREVVVHFATEGLPLRYANAVRIGAALWSRAPCVEALAVARCPPRSNCTTVTARRSGEADDVDGDSEGFERGGVKTANAITLYTEPLSGSSDRAALGTVVHEMGHALGLDHRGDRRSIMAATTGESTDPRPDAIDYANLAAIYGDRAP